MRSILPAALAIMSSTGAVCAQTIARDAYFDHLPGMGKVVSQTRASERFQLFGDARSPAYRDVDRDGIEDVRAEWLRVLATRFAPVLRRNNFSGPRDFQRAAGDALWLERDVWRAGRLVSTDSVLLGGPRAAATALKAAAPGPNGDSLANDGVLLDLLREFSPRGGETRIAPAEGDSAVVLFADFPGGDARSWREAYDGSTDVAVYVHAFIDELPGDSAARYALVLQYWFFYPFNDGTNNHEGDWEHLNVVLTTKSRAAAADLASARLSEAELQDVLAGRTGVDSLEIASVEYFFHEAYTVLDYLSARRRALADPNPSPHFWHFHVWTEPEFIERTIIERMKDPVLATHPVVYIGGNNRGPDEFTSFWPRFGRAFNRNGHGSYPLPGTWQAVGPVGTTEQLMGPAVPMLRQTTVDTLAFADANFLLLRRADIVLVPDWERVLDLALEHPDARAAWAWLLLPMRWGFPASASPGAGMMKYLDIGQVSPEGPAYQPTWNRLGAQTGWQEYNPTVLRVLMVPATPWARVKNGWGVLNAPLALLGVMPGWSVVLTQALPWLTGAFHVLGTPPAKTYYPGEPPFRFSSIAFGPSRSLGGDRFARLLPGSDSVALQSTEEIGAGKVGTLTASTSQRIVLNLFYGRTFSVENTLTLSDARISYEDGTPSAGDAARAKGSLELRELTGGFRLNGWSTNDDALQFYARTGYGYTWYKLTDVTVNGVPQPGERKGGYATTIWPSRRWWPNTWYLGAGVEVFAPRRLWVLNRVGLGVRAELNTSWHALSAREPGARHLGWARRGDASASLVFAW